MLSLFHRSRGGATTTTITTNKRKRYNEVCNVASWRQTLIELLRIPIQLTDVSSSSVLQVKHCTELPPQAYLLFASRLIQHTRIEEEEALIEYNSWNITSDGSWQETAISSAEAKLRWAEALDRIQRGKAGAENWHAKRMCQHSLYLHSIVVHDLMDRFIASDMKYIVQSLQHELHTSVDLASIRYYTKIGFTCTFLHDELAHSSACNLMTPASHGIALWISFDLQELLNHSGYDAVHMDTILNQEQVPQLLKELTRLQLTSMNYTWQEPGDVIFNTDSKHICYIVITIGDLIEHLSWNSSDAAVPSIQANTTTS